VRRHKGDAAPLEEDGDEAEHKKYEDTVQHKEDVDTVQHEDNGDEIASNAQRRPRPQRPPDPNNVAQNQNKSE
jgi:hypothetical protein